jgi:transcriptional regulator with GAF, ATPase, and Fis domain
LATSNAVTDAAEFTATLHVPRPDEAMRARPAGITLEVMSGPDSGKTFRFALGTDERRTDVLIGGRNLADIALTDSSVSQRHFELCFASGKTRLRDLGSTNGVWIGRARVEEAWLAEGAEFYAGDCRMRVSTIDVQDQPVSNRTQLGGMFGTSESMRALFSLVVRLAPTPLTVLILGESGTGKGEVARALHAASGRSGAFQVVDCSTLPRELAPALLLGHAKGAFTGATSDVPGPFEVADGGTVFLDEVGELPLDVQQALLTVVDRKEVQRVGETRVRGVDVRIVAATNRDLGEEVAAKRFRKDLYYRLQQFVVTVPPLRDRPDDIAFLADRFLESLAAELGRPLSLVEDAKRALVRLRWSGNVRELRDVIRRAAYLAPGQTIERRDLHLFDEEPAPEDVAPDGERLDPGGLKAAISAFTRRYCERVLEAADGNLEAAAAAARYTPRGFLLLLERLRLDDRVK